GGSHAGASSQVLVYAFAEGGSFVVGDRSATGAVTFWGAQWSKLNTLSGGNALPSFKGFARSADTSPCAIGWKTRPGNASPPPGPLPAYMAVIVAAAIDKNGAVAVGTVPHVVVVRTNAGYDADPNHAGTGTVVTTVC